MLKQFAETRLRGPVFRGDRGGGLEFAREGAVAPDSAGSVGGGVGEAASRGFDGAAEGFAEDFFPESEDAFEILANEEPIDETSAQHGIGDDILGKGAAIPLLEAMFVGPVSIGAAELAIHEAMGWFPRGDLGAPAEGDAMEA